ncbi:MAG: sensor histidine kinase, partial [Chitinophagaceae bacterium]
MNESSIRVENFRRVEFWATATLFVFILFFFITDSVGIDNSDLNPPNKRFFLDVNMEFDYFRNYFLPQLARYITLFSCFLFLNFVIVPQMIKRQQVYRNVFIVAALLGLATVIFGVTATYTRAYIFPDYATYEDAYARIFLDAFLHSCRLLILLAFYTVLKYTSVYVLLHSDKIQARYPAVTRGGLIAFVVWAIILFLLAVGEADAPVLMLWGIIVPVGIAMYWYSFHTLIPQSLNSRRPFLLYAGKAILTLAVTSLALLFLLLLFVRHS